MVIIGLGSNIDNRTFYLQQAIEILGGVYGEQVLSDISMSPLYTSRALLPKDAPPDWDKEFLNMAIMGETLLSPEELLTSVKRIEFLLGRKDRGVWGPREIDLDILAYDDVIIETENLSIPHKGLLDRDFAVVPCADIWPDWRYPVAGPYYHMRIDDIVAEKGYRQTITQTNIALMCAF